MTLPLLSVENLQTKFSTPQGPVSAVNDVTFTVGRGQVVGIVGESGSGKSVTARSVMRMVHAAGSTVSGKVTLDGEDLLALPEDEMRSLRGRRIALVFQDPQAALNPVMTVGDQVAEALVAHGVRKKEAKRRARELLVQVGIPDVDRKIKDYPHQFSGGMRQRVVIAIALANDPELLIADEPTTALDVTIQAQILRLLMRLREERDIAIMLITHDMGVVAETCTDVVVMYAGRVVEKGPVEEIFRSPSHPYTAALLAAIPRVDDESQKDFLPAIPGSPPDPSQVPVGCAFAPRCSFALPECHTAVPDLLPTDDDGQHQSACFVTQALPLLDVRPPAPTRQPGSGAELRSGDGGAGPVLEVRDLRTDLGSHRKGLFGTAPPVWVVDGVSLSVSAGETLGLVGESGCGKSTLSRTIVGINRPSQGEILVAGHDVTSMAPKDAELLRQNVQYIFQDPYSSLNPRRTIRQSLHEALAFRGLTQAGSEAEAVSLLERVGLSSSHLDRYPQAFSGGQRQRIGIARALARQPRALILDEPVSALDVSVQAQVINLLQSLQTELQLGYLFIAHDLSVVRHLSHRVAVMYLGRIVEIGPAEAVYRNPQHPYTAALLSSSPVPSTEARGRESIVLRGDLPSPANPPSGCRFRTRCPIGPMFRNDRSICIDVDPQLSETAGEQEAACHFPGELTGVGQAA
jgi:peptide/nickel transport system ATP-binding protein